ncbi:MAG: nitroreductase family protein [Marinilabiliaceae bacterium]|nr:nitroreductase family protein [Marinilabiliaceae bacterium]
MKKILKKIAYTIAITILKKLHKVITYDRFIIIAKNQGYFEKELIKNTLYDISNYLEFSSNNDSEIEDSENLIHRIIAHYHIIEKGLSFPDTKSGFGKEVMISLINLIKRYISLKHDTNNNQIQAALNAIFEYINYHKKIKYQIEEIEFHFASLKKYLDKESIHSTIELKKEDILRSCQINFRGFVNSRYSIRDFSSVPVLVETVIDAIDISRKTPSACNRQAWKTSLISNHKIIADVLKLQNGNRGFGHTINKLAIISSNLKAFSSFEERNQAYIDGGMFAMSLTYALHSKGIGSIILNWATDSIKDIKLKELLKIPNSEVIVCLIGIGNYQASFSVPKSNRKDLSEIIRMI